MAIEESDYCSLEQLFTVSTVIYNGFYNGF